MKATLSLKKVESLCLRRRPSSPAERLMHKASSHGQSRTVSLFFRDGWKVSRSRDEEAFVFGRKFPWGSHLDGHSPLADRVCCDSGRLSLDDVGSMISV